MQISDIWEIIGCCLDQIDILQNFPSFLFFGLVYRYILTKPFQKWIILGMFSQVTPGCSGDFSLARKNWVGLAERWMKGCCWMLWDASDSVDGWNPAPVEVGSFCHYWQGFIAPRWCRISSINSRVILVLCEAALGSWKTWVFSRIWMYNSKHLNAGGLNQLLIPIRVENQPECAKIIEDPSFKQSHCQIHAHQQKLPSPFFYCLKDMTQLPDWCELQKITSTTCRLVNKNIETLHPGRLTWNLLINHLERKMIFQASMLIFQGVSLIPFLVGSWVTGDDWTLPFVGSHHFWRVDTDPSAWSF